MNEEKIVLQNLPNLLKEFNAMSNKFTTKKYHF